MESDQVVSSEGTSEAAVMAAIEDGPVERFVLADVSVDGAYLTVPLEEAASLPEWR